ANSGAATTQAGLSGPRAMTLNPCSQRLFVADNGNRRIMVFDVATVTIGEGAVNVLGQANFTTNTAATTQTGSTGSDCYFDVTTGKLYVSNGTNNRVLIFGLDTSAVVTHATCNSSGAINITAAGGNAPYTYNWGGGITTEDRTNLIGGIYTVTVTDNCGAKNTVAFTVAGPTSSTDTDSDGLYDECDADDDNDGIIDTVEGLATSYIWNTVPVLSTNQATGSINGINYTYKDSGVTTLTGTNGYYNYGIFPASYGIPDNNPTIQNIAAGVKTITFSTPIKDPIFTFASIGQPTFAVPITFNFPITLLWSTGVVQNNSFTITGNEGYAIIQLKGIFSSVSFNFGVAESWCNVGFGTSVNTLIDTDGDSIADHLDTDSDNDSCPDAIEGGANFTATNLDGNNRLTGGVGIDGLPLIAGSGQTSGGSTVASQITITSAPTDKSVAVPVATNFTIVTSGSNNTSWTGPTNARVPVYGTPGNGNAQRLYQWYLGDPNNGGTILSNAGVYSGVTTGMLAISNTTGLSGNEYYVVVSHSNNTCQTEVRSAKLYCVKPRIFAGGTQVSSNVGISVMQQNATGPENRNNGHLILEAKTKGFVITRMPTVNLPAGAAAVKGMLVYDTTANCLKMYNGTTWGCIAPSCPL
ncbi:hypothetical protein, partial [Microcoleus sp. B13-B4]